MERSVGGQGAESSQPCRKGAIGGNITALEAVYDGCRPSQGASNVSNDS